MGLRISSTAFQTLTNSFLRNVINNFVVLCSNDLFVFLFRLLLTSINDSELSRKASLHISKIMHFPAKNVAIHDLIVS